MTSEGNCIHCGRRRGHLPGCTRPPGRTDRRAKPRRQMPAAEKRNRPGARAFDFITRGRA